MYANLSCTKMNNPDVASTVLYAKYVSCLKQGQYADHSQQSCCNNVLHTYPLCANICISLFSLLRRTSSFFFLSDGGFAKEISILAPPRSFPCKASIAWGRKVDSSQKHMIKITSNNNQNANSYVTIQSILPQGNHCINEVLAVCAH